MKHNSEKTNIPVRNILLFAFILAFLLQATVITYNMLTGFLEYTGAAGIFFRLLYGTSLTFAVALALIYSDLFIIRLLNRWFPWDKMIFKRVPLQILLTITISSIYSILLTLLSNTLAPYPEDLGEVLVANLLIASVVNILLMVTLEAWLFYRERKKLEKRRETLEKELAQIKFEVLKSQVNPHFLFNSLNVLSSLVGKDASKAQQFIDEFSMFYRYVLETIEKNVVTVSEELDFARSYMFLQKIRYGESLQMEIRLSGDSLKKLLPPLSLQIVLENAIKHNAVDPPEGLTIKIYEDNGSLVVKNNMKRKLSATRSTGLGQKNLVKRFSMISEQKPVFDIENNYYIVRMPMVNPE